MLTPTNGPRQTGQTTEVGSPLEGATFATRLRSLCSYAVNQEVILGPDPTIAKLGDSGVGSSSLASTIKAAASLVWANSKSTLITRCGLSFAIAGLPLAWSHVQGKLFESIGALLPQISVAAKTSNLTDAPAVIWSIGSAVAAVGTITVFFDLIGRAQNLYGAWESKRTPLLSHELANQATSSWSYEQMDASKENLAYERYLNHSHKVYSLLHSCIDGSVCTLSALAAAGFLGRLDWRLSGLAIAFMIARGFRDWRESETAFQLEKSSAEERRRLNVKNTLSSAPKKARDIRLLGKNKTLQQEYQKGASEVNKKELDNEKRVQTIKLCYDIIPAMVLVTTAAIIAERISGFSLKTAEGIEMLGYAWLLTMQARAVGLHAGQVLQAKTFAEESLGFLSSGKSPRLDKTMIPPKVVPPRIQLEGVTVELGGSCLLNVESLEIEPGTIAGLIGREGAGKSTLLKVILGLRDVTTGQVTLSWGEERYALSECDLASYHRLVACNNQDFEIPEGMSIKEILGLGAGRAVADGELSEEVALELAQATGFVDALPAGLDTIVGSGWSMRDANGREIPGVSFSSGQRKLIGLALTLRSNSPIVVLDEPSNGISPETAEKLLKRISETARDRSQTVLIVSHNFENLAFADLILSVEAGKIAQCGTPQDLGKVPGLYRDGSLQVATLLLDKMGRDGSLQVATLLLDKMGWKLMRNEDNGLTLIRADETSDEGA